MDIMTVVIVVVSFAWGVVGGRLWQIHRVRREFELEKRKWMAEHGHGDETET